MPSAPHTGAGAIRMALQLQAAARGGRDDAFSACTSSTRPGYRRRRRRSWEACCTDSGAALWCCSPSSAWTVAASRTRQAAQSRRESFRAELIVGRRLQQRAMRSVEGILETTQCLEARGEH